MTTLRTRTSGRWAACWAWAISALGGCAITESPLPPGAFVRKPILSPALHPPPVPADLPDPPVDPPVLTVPEPDVTGAAPPPLPPGGLALSDVLASVEAHFPLLYAVEQERAIAAGDRLAAEGNFDTMIRGRAMNQTGTFANTRIDGEVTQPLPWHGADLFAGWRNGQGNFPVYYGDRITGDGGEFRAGVRVPLLQDRAIDDRRVALRQAQIAEQLAEPVIHEARLDYMRSAARAYWTWVAAGARFQVADELLGLAENRQAFINEQRRLDLVAETVEALNRRLIATRQEARIVAERGLQQAAIQLSLYLRDENADPIVPRPDRLPVQFASAVPQEPDPDRLPTDIALALEARPELARIRLQKERLVTEFQLARNDQLPTLDLTAAANQDIGFAEKNFIGTGVFRTNRTAAEVGLVFEVPVERRDAKGRAIAARSALSQLLARERYQRDAITAEVQDAASELAQAYRRLARAREAYRQAVRVRELEAESFRGGRTSLVDLNIQEIAAAEEKAGVVSTLADYFRALADYQAALGVTR